MEQASLAVLVVLLVTASITDFRNRKIPNWLTLSGLLAGLLLTTFTNDSIFSGITTALGGAALGLALFLPAYMAGWMGAGDVKLFAAVGAFMGPLLTLWAFAASVIAGGVLAILWIIHQLGLKSSFYRAIGSLTALGAPGPSVEDQTQKSVLKASMPYAPAIAAGSLIVFTMGGN